MNQGALFDTQGGRKPPAPWVEAAFCPIAREFMSRALPHLSERAVRTYLAHLDVANQGSAKSYSYRDSLAANMGRSVDTVDRGNEELEAYGMIVAEGTRYRCGGGINWVLQPPSKWNFQQVVPSNRPSQKRKMARREEFSDARSPSRKSRSSAAPQPQNNGAGAAASRRRPRNESKQKVKPEQDPPRRQKIEIRASDETPDLAGLGSKSNDFPVPVLASPTSTQPPDGAGGSEAGKALLHLGVIPDNAVKLAREVDHAEIFQQIAWLPARNPKDPAATIVAAIKGNWKQPASLRGTQPASAQNRGIAGDIAGDIANAGSRVVYRSDSAPSTETALPSKSPTSAPAPLQNLPAPPEPLDPEGPDPVGTKAPTVAPPQPPQRFRVKGRDIYAITAHAVFQALPPNEQERLRKLARAEVQPIFWDRLEVPDSPMALGLWDIVATEFPELYEAKLNE